MTAATAGQWVASRAVRAGTGPVSSQPSSEGITSSTAVPYSPAASDIRMPGQTQSSTSRPSTTGTTRVTTASIRRSPG
jgi:hypothetical protein